MALDLDSDSENLQKQHVTKAPQAKATDCDIAYAESEKDRDQVLSESQDVQPMVLRSVSRSQTPEMGKRIKPVMVEETFSNSDHENELVIDCDSPADEESETPISLVISDGKSMLKAKAQNNTIKHLNGISCHADSDDPVVFMVSEPNKSITTLATKWLKPVKAAIKKKKKKKMLKRLMERRKAMQRAKENANVQEKGDKMNDLKETKNVLNASECPICHQEFFDAHSFTLHIREHNTDKTTHICMICSRQLSSASSLDRHMYTHSGERPFKCSKCDLRFTTNGNMNRHMRIHETNDTSEPPKSKNDTKKGKRMSDGRIKEPLSENSQDSNENNVDGKASWKRPRLTSLFGTNSHKQSLICQVCGKGFLSSGKLEDHMVLHSNDPINCSSCNTTLLNYTMYLSHSCDENLDPSPLKLGFHDLTYIEFSSSKFPLIAKQICEKKSRNPSSPYFSWECLKCAKAFPSSKSLQQHELSHVNGHTCHKCNCDFTSSKHYNNHQLTHRLAEQCTCDIEGDKSRETCKEDFLAMLGLCSKNKAPEMEKLHHPPMPFESLKYFASELPPDESGNDFADIKSIISLTTSTDLVDLRASPVTASPASPPEGTNKKVPRTPEDSASHSFESHPLTDEALSSESVEEGPSTSRYNCKKCSQTFDSSNELKQHMQNHLKTNTLHHCDFCDYKSVDKSTLKRHLRKHNGEHPFKCSICDYVFTTKANGHRHVRNKHKLSDQEASDIIIYNPNMLEAKEAESISNETNGTDTVCKYCKQDFKYNRVLRHHLRSLNNSCSRKPFSCSLCKQGFSTKNNCIRHITNHHAEHKDKAKELVVANEIPSPTDSEQPLSPKEDSSSESDNMNIQLSEPLNLTLTSGPKDLALPVELEDNEYPGSDPEMVSVAKSLVSLSEAPPLQEQPLDLTICALNLSLKATPQDLSVENHDAASTGNDAILNLSSTKENSSKYTNNSKSKTPTKSTSPPPIQKTPLNLANVPKPLNLAKKSTLPLCLGLEPRSQENGNPMPPLICLPQVINGVISKPALPLVFSNVPIIQPVTNLGSTRTPKKVFKTSSISPAKSQNEQKPKDYTCDYCFKGFTLKSNRERHIKNHHPEHARPPRSRNYIPTLSRANVQKQNASTLSNKTRDALRDALIAKSSSGMNLKTKRDSITSMNSSVATLPPNITVDKQQLVHFMGSALRDSPNKNKTDDLASVSDVIDAVNCQPFKQYLKEAKEISNSQNSSCEVPSRLSDNNSTTTSQSTHASKLSSYTKSNNSVTCTFCYRKFPWKSSLSRHFLTHTGVKPHRCPNCPLSFTTKSNRDRHLNRQHGDARAISPPEKKIFKCHSCSNSFSSKGKLKKHFMIKHLTKAKTHTDDNSTPESDSPVEMQGDSNALPDECHLSNDSLSSETVAMDLLECHVCKNSFKTQHDLMSHLKEVHPLECEEQMADDMELPMEIKAEPEDAEDVPSAESNEIMDQSNEECLAVLDLHSCAVCSLHFNSASELQEHSELHISTPACSKSANHKSMTKNNASPLLNGGPKERLALPKITTSLPKTPNSLLYLFAAAHSSMLNESQPNASKEENDGDNSLISDLLGLKDPDFVEEMLDSAVRSIVKKENTDD